MREEKTRGEKPKLILDIHNRNPTSKEKNPLKREYLTKINVHFPQSEDLKNVRFIYIEFFSPL